MNEEPRCILEISIKFDFPLHCNLFQDLLSVKDEIIINRIDNVRLQKNSYNKKALPVISLVIIVLTSPSL